MDTEWNAGDYVRQAWLDRVMDTGRARETERKNQQADTDVAFWALVRGEDHGSN